MDLKKTTPTMLVSSEQLRANDFSIHNDVDVQSLGPPPAYDSIHQSTPVRPQDVQTKHIPQSLESNQTTHVNLPRTTNNQDSRRNLQHNPENTTISTPQHQCRHAAKREHKYEKRELKNERKGEKRELKRDQRHEKRELKREHRQEKRDFRLEKRDLKSAYQVERRELKQSSRGPGPVGLLVQGVEKLLK